MNRLQRKISEFIINRSIIDYTPQIFENPAKLPENITTAWRGHEQIIKDLITRFNINPQSYLEFGVEFGFSAIAFSNYFKEVTGVDTFEGDIHTMNKQNHFEQTKNAMSVYPNILLVKADYKDYILKDKNTYDLIHVDIVHTYEDTYKCGLWAAQHSKVTIFHDTDSFFEVKRAVYAIAKKTKKRFYQYKPHYGLGIIA